MRFKLHLSYYRVFCLTTFILSFLLYYVIATEDKAAAAALEASHEAAADAAATATIHTADSTGKTADDILNNDAAASKEKVLPNYKKVKKFADAPRHAKTQAPRENVLLTAAQFTAEQATTSEHSGATATIPSAPAAAADDEHVDGRENSVYIHNNNNNNNVKKENLANVVVAPSVRSPTVDKISDAIVLPIRGNHGGVISEVPKVEENNVKATETVEELYNNKQQQAIEDVQQSVTQEASNDINNDVAGKNSLPDIKDIPTVTVTELPLEVLEPARNTLNAIIIDATKDSAQDPENRTMDILENSNEAMQKDEQIIKINDSGGGVVVTESGASGLNAEAATEIPNKSDENIPNENETTAAASTSTTTASTTDTNTMTQEQQNTSSDSGSGDTLSIATKTINLTAEEVPMPVFSEWAQKQMEEAEKQQQALEKEVVNTSAQKKNHTNGGNKVMPLKVRSKNYAAPDCGAKIIASNADATNTGAVLSSSKDEYLLSPCGNRIWFVVELCEAIQAQKIDLANFELFSSSPKNFSVAVSTRFPTRDWSNVGRFIAEDKRTVQSFDLHPHLFGKFVRVDIFSHYSKEHFCPVSLFRVFGTSEFEAFETENHPNDDFGDFDEELEQAKEKNAENNLFKSASDAVLSIVKKAAEVLVKPQVNNQNQTLSVPTQALVCQTPIMGQYRCAQCNRTLVERINNALSCEFKQLNSLLNVQKLRNDLLTTQVCAKKYGIEMHAQQHSHCTKNTLMVNPFQMDVKQSYYLNLLPMEYIGALCQLLAEHNTQLLKTQNGSSATTLGGAEQHDDGAEIAMNLTIDKKLETGDFKLVENPNKNILKAETNLRKTTQSAEVTRNEAELLPTTTEYTTIEPEQIPRPPEAEGSTLETTTQASDMTKEATHDVNIFNVPVTPAEEKQELPASETTTEAASFEASGAEQIVLTATTPTPIQTITEPMTTTTTTSTTTHATTKSDEDPTSWENLDNLLTSTTASIAASVGSGGTAQNAGAGFNGINLQQKIPSGPQSESVFIRLSNRIKALERNMSLSGQYLEELSRRYKKQVEELQLALTQQTQTVRVLEEQNRRHAELEQLYAERNTQLKDELDDLTLQVHACIVVIIFVGAFVFLVLMVGILFYRAMRRETKELLALQRSAGKRKATSGSQNNSAANQKKLNRRKSFEDFSDHQQTLGKTSEKQRRPSEEAMLILKDCLDDDDSVAAMENIGDAAVPVNKAQARQRKLSVCYDNNSNSSFINGGSNNHNTAGGGKALNGSKRKGEKHSWPNTEHAQQQARQHLEQLKDSTAEGYDKFFEAGNSKLKSQPLATNNSQQLDNYKASGKTKKKTQQQYKRQESAPSDLMYEPRLNATAPAGMQCSNIETEYDESLRLDDEDLDNFIPNSDLAYNEFMPDGPSGYQILDDATANDNASKLDKARTKKSRRLSSPAFFKSPFSKSLKTKNTNVANKTITNPSHESTSWEWYRLRKSEAQQQQQQNKHNLHNSASAAGGFLRRGSPAASLDSSSLSEINFPTNSTENSFRILEEAILSSGESITTAATTPTPTTATTTNGNGHSGSSGDSSNRSSTSSSAKKKNRSFNKIFRKVF